MSRAASTRLVLGLGTAQTLAWASTYYLPAILAAPMAPELGLSVPAVFAVFSGALLASAGVAPLAGRHIDRHGGRGLLSATSLAFALGLVLLGLAQGPLTLVLAWIVLGLAMGAGLYEAAFATLVRLQGTSARSTITGITLLAGFASTIGWPLTAWLELQIGWRGACFAWAGLHLLLGLPLNATLPRPTPSGLTVSVDTLVSRTRTADVADVADAAPASAAAGAPREASVPGALDGAGAAGAVAAESATSSIPAPAAASALGNTPAGASPTHPLRTTLLLAWAFAATWFISTALATHLPRMLMAAGATLAAAVAVAALVGPAQVAGRLMEFGLLRRMHPLWSARVAALAHPVGAAALLLFGAPVAALFAVLHGLGNGVLTIAKGTLPLVLFGPVGYGLRQGWLTMPARLAQAAAPFVFGLALERWGGMALGLLIGLALSAALALWLLPLPAAASTTAP